MASENRRWNENTFRKSVYANVTTGYNIRAAQLSDSVHDTFGPAEVSVQDTGLALHKFTFKASDRFRVRLIPV